jgi:hypothetical protein
LCRFDTFLSALLRRLGRRSRALYDQRFGRERSIEAYAALLP